MTSITIRNLDPAVKERRRVRAAQHGRSMEAEARRILQTR
jgi:antitoxin FitA